MSKYNWQQLEQEFVTKDYKNVTEFLKEKNIPNNGTTRKYTKGWNATKRQKEDKIKTKTIEKVIEKQSEKESKKVLLVKDVANELLAKVSEAAQELRTMTDMFGNKHDTIIQRSDLKKLTSALKDLNEIIGDGNDKDSSFASDIEKAWASRNEK